jgi:hypothetical protein
MEVVDTDDLVSPCFLERIEDVRACHVVGQSRTHQKKKKLCQRNREILTNVASATGDQDTLLKKVNGRTMTGREAAL